MLARRSVCAQLTSVATAMAVLSAASCGPSVKPPDVKLNPAPKQRYEVTLTVPNPPRRISTVFGTIQFDIQGLKDDCMPYSDKIAGSKPKSSFPRHVAFERKDNVSFVGYFYSDQLIDEDYYGLGVCRWELTGIKVLFHAGTLERAAYLDGDEISGEQTSRSLCPLASPLKDICLTPRDESLYDNPQHHFIAVLKSRKTSP